ncbi:MAG: hypothetical protein RL741_697, partial [Actinomycetota bacterium]
MGRIELNQAESKLCPGLRNSLHLETLLAKMSQFQTSLP